MLWALIIVSNIWFGYELVFMLAPSLFEHLNVLASSIPFGFTISSWIYYFVRKARPLDRKSGVLISAAQCFVAFLIHQVQPKKRIGFRRLFTETYVVFAGIMILFYFLVDKSIIKDGTGSSGTTFSDLPFHLSLISSFAYGANSGFQELETPFYAGEKLSYPIVPDFYSSILVGCGNASLRVSIAVPTILLFLSLMVLMHYFAVLFGERRFVPELSLIIFIFAGGVGWKWYFLKECRHDPNANLAHAFCSGKYTFWIHSVIHFILPQRSALFSMPVALSVTILLIISVIQGIKDIKCMFLAGILMGIVPMLSAHSFIAIGEYAAFICLFNFPYILIKKFIESKFKMYDKLLGVIIGWCCFGFTAIIIALPQVIWLLRVPRSGFMTFEPIWTESNRGKFAMFQTWWESLGSFLFLSLFVVWLFMRKKQIIMYLPSIGVFVVSNFIRYQPGAMDNNKVFFATWYPLACISVAYLYIMLLLHDRRRSIIVKIMLVFIFISFSFSGFICIAKALKYNFPLFSSSEKDLGVWMMENSPKDAVVLCSGWHSNPLMSVGGRLVTEGYPGWIWTHGLDIGKREMWMKNLVQNRENVSYFIPQKVLYAISKGDDESRNFKFPKPSPLSRWVCVLDIGYTQVYRILLKAYV